MVTKTQLKGILLLSFFLVLCKGTTADIGLSLGAVKPTGYLGFILKPGVGYRLDFTDDFDAPWRIRGSFTYVNFKTREDTFQIVGYEYDNNEWMVYPGYQVFRMTRYLSINIGFDYAFIRKDGFSAYVGADFTIGGIDLDYDAVIPGMIDKSAKETLYFAGLPVRFGVDYAITDRIGVYGEATRYFNWGNKVGWRTMNMYTIGLRYQIFE